MYHRSSSPFESHDEQPKIHSSFFEINRRRYCSKTKLGAIICLLCCVVFFIIVYIAGGKVHLINKKAQSSQTASEVEDDVGDEKTVLLPSQLHQLERTIKALRSENVELQEQLRRATEHRNALQEEKILWKKREDSNLADADEDSAVEFLRKRAESLEQRLSDYQRTSEERLSSAQRDAERCKRDLERAKREAAVESALPPYSDPNVGVDSISWSQKPWREQLGNAAWHFLHNVAARYPDSPSEEFKNAALALLKALSYLYPCEVCRNHLNRSFRKVPDLWPPDLVSRESFSLWLCRLHNHVNTQTGKPVFPCVLSILDKRYVANCDECVERGPAGDGETSPDMIADIGSVGVPANNAKIISADRAAPKAVARSQTLQRSAAGESAAQNESPDAETGSLTPQQRRERLLRQKQEQSEKHRYNARPRAAYQRPDEVEKPDGRCSYKVERWIQGESQIEVGKLNLIVLFSPTCHVCKVYLPREVQQAYEKFSEKGVTLAAIADITPETSSLLDSFLAEHQITYPIGSAPVDDESAPYAKWIGKYKGVPAILDIDPVSCTVRKAHWGWAIEKLDAYITDLLALKEARGE